MQNEGRDNPQLQGGKPVQNEGRDNPQLQGGKPVPREGKDNSMSQGGKPVQNEGRDNPQLQGGKPVPREGRDNSLSQGGKPVQNEGRDNSMSQGGKPVQNELSLENPKASIQETNKISDSIYREGQNSVVDSKNGVIDKSNDRISNFDIEEKKEDVAGAAKVPISNFDIKTRMINHGDDLKNYTLDFENKPNQLDSRSEVSLKDYTTEAEFHVRRQRIKDVCWENPTLRGDVREVFKNKQAGILYCVVPKAGCTFWKRIFRAFETKVNIFQLHIIILIFYFKTSMATSLK